MYPHRGGGAVCQGKKQEPARVQGGSFTSVPGSRQNLPALRLKAPCRGAVKRFFPGWAELSGQETRLRPLPLASPPPSWGGRNGLPSSLGWQEWQGMVAFQPCPAWEMPYRRGPDPSRDLRPSLPCSFFLQTPSGCVTPWRQTLTSQRDGCGFKTRPAPTTGTFRRAPPNGSLPCAVGGVTRQETPPSGRPR